MARLYDICPDAGSLLALEPEELAGVVLEHLHSLLGDQRGKLHRANYLQLDTVEAFPREKWDPLRQALAEAWVWLEREGLLVPDATKDPGWVQISRRGEQVRSPEDLVKYRRASLLPREMLHGRIAVKVSATFLRGDYETAVFQAFKEVEVAIRSAGGFSASDIGVDLARKAFHEATGPLTDTLEPAAERSALSHLFAGALGRYKNPGSHRPVAIQPEEAVELIVMASHLLRIIDNRMPRAT